MIEFIASHIGEISGMCAVTIAILSAIWWSHNKLHADMMEIKTDAKSAHARIDAALERIDAMGERIDANGARIDAMGARIDGVYEIIMKMLTKKK